MPNVSAAIGRPDLAALLVDFDLAMDQAGFIGLKVFPVYPCDHPAANARRIKLASLLEIRNTNRGPDGSYATADFQFEDWHYSCQENGIKFLIDDAKRRMFKYLFDCEVMATELSNDVVLRNQERRIAAAAFSTSTFATAVTTSAGLATVAGNTIAAGIGYNSANSAVKWTSFATATPVFDVMLAKEQVYANSGLWPDSLALSKLLANKLKQNEQIINRIKWTRDPSLMTAEDLAAALDIPNVFIAGSSKNTADMGQAGVAAQIWDSTMALVYKAAQSQTNYMDPGLGRTFAWNGDGGEVIETYRDDDKRADVVRRRHQTHENLMYSAAGFLITGCA